MFAFIGNFDLTELLVIAAVALMVFGKRLPEVALRAAAYVSKMRRQVAETWRATGLDAELRRVKRDIEQNLPDARDPRRFLEREAKSLARRVERPLPDQPASPKLPEPAPEQAPKPDVDPGASGPDHPGRESA